MRIVIVSPHFPEYALRLADALARHHDVTLCLDRNDLEAEIAGRELSRAASRRVVRSLDFAFPRDLVRLALAIVQAAPDVVHLQEASGPKKAFFNFAIALCFRWRTHLILTVHDPRPHLGKDASMEPELRILQSWTRKLAATLVVHGPACRAALLETTGCRPDKVVVARHGVLLDDVVELREPASRRRFLVFGRMKAYKGLDVLLEAVRRLDVSGRDYRVRIVGQGEELDRLESELRQSPHVEIDKRYIPGAELVTEVGRCDCVVLPYVEATQSGVLAGAIGAGRAIIASRTGDIPDVITHGIGGLLVTPGDPVALADAMAQLIDDSSFVEHLRRGAEKNAATLLSWGTIADVTCAHYSRH